MASGHHLSSISLDNKSNGVAIISGRIILNVNCQLELVDDD